VQGHLQSCECESLWYDVTPVIVTNGGRLLWSVKP